MNKKIRWGVLSTSSIAENAMIPAIRATEQGEVVAVASRNLERAQAFTNKLKIPQAYGSYEELLAAPDIDAIYNPLPVSLHAEWSIKAAEAGKPVLCEKPLALNSNEAEEMIQVFTEHKLLLSEALMYRYHPLTRKVKALIDEGAIGKLIMLNSQFTGEIPKKDIRRSKETGGGAMLDIGCYCLSVQQLLANENPSLVSAVGILENEVDVTVSASLQFPSGITGHFGCSMNATFSCSYEACGTTGRILVDHGAMCAWPGEEFKIKYWHDEAYEEITVPAANPYQLLVENFQDALLSGKAMKITLNDTLATMKAIDAILNEVNQCVTDTPRL